jgi:hypothetical protein
MQRSPREAGLMPLDARGGNWFPGFLARKWGKGFYLVFNFRGAGARREVGLGVAGPLDMGVDDVWWGDARESGDSAASMTEQGRGKNNAV